MYMYVYIYIYTYIHTYIHVCMYIYIYICVYIYIYIHTYVHIHTLNPTAASGGGGPGFNPHHVELSGLEVSPLKVSGGSPVHLRSEHQVLVGKTLWVKKEKKEENTILYIYIYIIYTRKKKIQY